MHILSKDDMYIKYQAGKFGNKLCTWDTYKKWVNDPLVKMMAENKVTFSIRYKGTGSAKWFSYNLAYSEVEKEVNRIKSEGGDSNLITINETAPDTNLILQGEVQRSFRGLELRYSTKKCSMREAMVAPQYAHGLKAKIILEYYLSPSSLCDIDWLLEVYNTHPQLGMYETHTVEFSTYNICLGSIPHRNSIIWEIRSY